MNNYKLISTLTILALIFSTVISACSGTAVALPQVASSETNLSVQEPDQDDPNTSQSDLEAQTIPVSGQTQDDPSDETDQDDRPQGWSEDTHADGADPNYEVVFPQDEVNTINITITDENWQTMLDDMTQLYGEQGTGGRFGMRPGGGPPPEDLAPDGQAPQLGGKDPNTQPPQFGGQPPEGQKPKGGAMLMDSDVNPTWVEATIEFEGDIWTNVGIRFKGNSSLKSSWSSGNMKLPFKLDFDEFEDEYPEIDDQRFYGFKQLTFSSGFNDESLLREKVAADIFRQAGVPAAQTAFYAVYIDYGEGPVYFGLYTMVEVVDDTLIETQFEDDGGNVYKPEGAGATFAANSFSEASFDKETNQDEDDYTDILALYEALHADLRTSDPAAWRTQLEAVFDVETFITWLATNTLIQNWDTYGVMSHNYYLYNDPTTGQLTWVPWDNNEALRDRQGRGTLSFSLDEVGDDWPLIRYIIDDPVYHQMYVDAFAEIINGAFEPIELVETLQYYHKLIQPYVTDENGEQSGYTFINSPQAFENSITSLITHIHERYNAAKAYLLTQ